MFLVGPCKSQTTVVVSQSFASTSSLIDEIQRASMQARKRWWNSQNADYLIYTALDTFLVARTCQSSHASRARPSRTVHLSTVERSYSCCNFWSVQVLFKIQEMGSLQGFILLYPCLRAEITEKHCIAVYGMNVNLEWRWLESMMHRSSLQIECSATSGRWCLD